AVLLGRNPGADGFAYWNGVFARGASETEVAAQIASSPEYANAHPDAASFIDGLYRVALGRPADPGGLAAWESAYASQGRLAVARAIFGSDEANSRLLTLAIGNFLHRGLRPGDQEFWLNQVHKGLTPE